jgi:hypothetical protein
MPESSKLALLLVGLGLLVGFWVSSTGKRRTRFRSGMLERVKVYDFLTRSVRSIPAVELAPGMVAATVPDVAGTVWIDVAQLEESDYQHPALPLELRERIVQVRDALWEVYPQSLEEWEDGFRRDADPQLELAIWQHIAATYEGIVASRMLSLAEKQDYFNVLVACSMTPREHLFSAVSLAAISQGDAEEAVRAFDES